MENQRKNLKIISFCILLITAARLITAIVSLTTGSLAVGDAVLPDGVTKEVYNIVVIATWGIGLITLLPSVYLGFKGLKIAKNPDGSKAHLVWAVLLIVFSVFAVLSGFGDLANSTNLLIDILSLVEVVFCAVLYICYFLEAKKIRANI